MNANNFNYLIIGLANFIASWCSVILAVLNIIYAYTQAYWIVTACQVCSLILLIGVALSTYWRIVGGMKFEITNILKDEEE